MMPVMRGGAPGSFGGQLKALREAAGFTQEELATIAGLSVHAVSALERGERRRPHVETLRALCAALDLTGPALNAFVESARSPAATAVDELSRVSLPAPLTVLVGRDTELRTLGRWLTDPSLRLVTLVGPGGVGKTRLAVELARVIADEGVLRVLFVSLAGCRDPASVASAVAEALGLVDRGILDLPRGARAACEARPTLLALDNFEHVLDAAPLVTDLLATVLSLRVLATSRAPLRVRGEREYAVAPLELAASPEAMSPADLARVPAVRLFLERVRDVEPGFRLTPQNGPIVAAICRRLDALPLALELAAPWMKVLTAEGLRCRLEDDALLSIGAPRDLPVRQQAMKATVAWSYQLLGPGEQRAFRRLGALPGPFRIATAASVLAGHGPASPGDDDALRAVAVLTDKSLLLRSESSAAPAAPRFYMLETVRAYALLELTAAGEHDEAMKGLLRHCTREAALAAEGLVGHDQVAWLNRVGEDLGCYRSTLTWLIEHDRHPEAAHIAWALMFFWLIRGHLAEGLRWYERTLKATCGPPTAESRALVGAGMMLYAQGELERARTAFARARSLADAGADMEVVARADLLSGRVEQSAGNMNTAHDRFAAALERFRALDIPWGVGMALSGMAVVALATGDTDQADSLLDDATAVLHTAGPWFLTRTLCVRALLARQRGDADTAIALAREGLTRIRDLQDKYAFVYTLVPLAAAALLKGDCTWAARVLGLREEVTQRTGAAALDPLLHDVSSQTERDARARIGSDPWTQAYAAGRRYSTDVLLKDIDSALARSGT